MEANYGYTELHILFGTGPLGKWTARELVKLCKTVNLMGNAKQPHTFTYIADFGRLLAALGTREGTLGQVWFAPSNPPITQDELVELIEAELGHPVKSMVGGALMMRFLDLSTKKSPKRSR